MINSNWHEGFAEGCIFMTILYGKNWSREEIQQYVPDLSQLAPIRRSTLREGRAEGLDAVELATGSLSTMGAPSVDRGEELSIHGRVSNIPASNVWADAAWEGNCYRLWVRGKVAEAAALGTNLVLTREISTELNASHLVIRDCVE